MAVIKRVNDPSFGQQWFRAIDDEVRRTLVGCRIHQPPVDPLAVAERLGITVALDERLSGRARFVELGVGGGRRRASILVRPEPRRERTHWAIAHELGERLAEAVFGRLAIELDQADLLAREQVANAFASRLLLPSDWFYEDGAASDWELPELKARYATASHELIARRMLDAGGAVVVTVIDEGQTTWRRTAEQRSPGPLGDLERRVWQTAQASGRPCQAETSQERVQVWPIHEPDWRREIIRHELRCCWQPPAEEPAWT